MYVSSIELLGFKSFPLKTRIDFASGITGVVGPNGCGKTNVLDAIRWVLGEQKTSVLRGGKMEDVIFSGTREMKPLGMAEVALTVVNDRNVLPTEYSNITITRRLHRSGDSEYLLNNVPCRLKDITELFADTGMSTNAYSAIELDMVEAILSDKADQRRMLFEEAAGITKYKLRKRAALRKLEATEQDLLRLSDILAEVSSQVNSLRRQMRKAERYKLFEDAIRTNGLILLKENYRRISVDLKEVQEAKRLSEIQLAQESGEIDKWELMREDTGSQITELAVQLRSVLNQLDASSTQYHELNNLLSVTRERITASEAANETDLGEIESIRIKTEQLEQQQQDARTKLTEMRESLQSLRQQVDQQETHLTDKLSLLEEARRSSQDFQRDLFALEGRKTVSEQSEQELDHHISELRQEIAELNERATELGAQRHEAEQGLAGSRDLQNAQAEAAEVVQERDRRNRTQTEALLAELDVATSIFAERRLELRSIETHVNLQQQMIARYEGYGSGVSSLFADDAGLDGLVDTIANLVQAKPEYLKPIESALGESAEYVLVRDREAADQAIAYLRENDLGRVTFVIEAGIPDDRPCLDAGTFRDVDGFLGCALDHVTVAEEHRPLGELLLANVLLARDVASARKLLERGSDNLRVVTLDGQHLHGRARHQGGSEQTTFLLGREAELQRLQDRLDEAVAGVNQADERVKFLQVERVRLVVAHRDFNRSLAEVQAEQSRLQLEATRQELQLQQAEEQQRRNQERLNSLREKFEAQTQRQSRLQQDSSRLAGDEDGKRSALADQKERVAEMEREVDVAAREHEQVHLRVIKEETEINSLEAAIRRNDELVEEFGSERQRRSQARENRVREIGDHHTHVSELTGELESLSVERDRLKQQEIELTTRQAEITEKQTEYNDLLKAARKEREQEAQKHQELLVRETEGKARFEDVRRQLREVYDLEVAELSLPEPLAPETVAELEDELVQSRQKQAQLGMVNMLALEEYERESKREEFLSRQISDLTEAKDNLKTTISRINATARQMFQETFEQIRSNFRQVFAELFQGGESDIRLEDDADPLESAILITARPRGKRLLNISQLSGGEKALTAISLLFGIYLVKPSPFCILDEVDAPLDDANVGRFLKMVKAFSERTQFIIITHNKRTMEQCGRLYGVTMQQPGVSQIVSVDFEKLGRQFVPETMSYTEPEAAEVAETENGMANLETAGKNDEDAPGTDDVMTAVAPDQTDNEEH